MGEITVKKVDEGVAWGSVHWQYLEDMAKVTPLRRHAAEAEEALSRQGNTERGPVLKPSTGPSRWATNWSCGSSCEPTATWSTST
jgi:hypothetical protein